MRTEKSAFDIVREVAAKLPNVEEGTIHGAPAWRLRGKLLACQAVHHSAEPDSLLVKISPAERELLLAAQPDVYYVTDHYKKDAVVLVRPTKLNRKTLAALLKDAWHFVSETGKTGKKPSKSPKRK